MVDAADDAVILNAGTDPNIRRDLAPGVPSFDESARGGDPTGEIGGHATWALRKHLELVPRRRAHDIEDLIYELGWHGAVEEIAHAVDEDPPRALPLEREAKGLWMQRNPETIAVALGSHSLKAKREPLRVAVLAAGRDFGTSGDGIPGGVSPLNR
jgi:hypothetical protein